MVWQQEQRLAFELFLERYRLILGLFALVFLCLLLRLFHLQVVQGRHYGELSEQQRIQLVLERAPRGVILDRNGQVIVGNKTAFVALFYPFSQDNQPPKEMIERLAGMVDVPNLAHRLSQGWRTGRAVRLAENISRVQMLKLQEQRLVMPGLSVVEESRREAHAPEANAHLVGYLNEVTKNELENLSPEGYKTGDWIGRRGLEKSYDLMLRGRDGGWQIEVDAYGRQTRLVRHVQPLIGNTLYTTIDEDMQVAAAEGLKATTTGRGAVVALDPRTGAVRAFVSSPGFDPNVSFTSEFAHNLIDKKLPLFDRAVQGLYPPGSVFKLITFLGAVSDKKISPDLTFECNGSFKYGNKVFKCWKKGGHGRLNMMGALQNSCNVYFYQLGLRVGQESLIKYARDFGFGSATGIELPSEKSGLVPSPEWKKRKMYDSWQQGDTINMAIGQGPLWVTPIQVAQLVASVSMNGEVWQPYVVDKVVSPANELLYQAKPKKKRTVQATPEAWQLLHTAMQMVINEGTGHAVYFTDMKVAGKTGTAQNPQGQDHSWMACYAPADNPEIAVAVIVENGGHGGVVAGPIARSVLEAYFKRSKAAPPPTTIDDTNQNEPEED